jgi:hypothetical protein
MRMLLTFGFLAGLAAALVLGMPAAHVARAIPDNPVLRAVSGTSTLLHGTASIPLAGVATALHWETNGVALWPPALKGPMSLRAEGGRLDGSFFLGPMTRLDATRIAADLSRLPPPWRAVLGQPSGMAEGAVSLFGIPPQRAEGRLTWRGASLDFGGELLLGDIEAAISTPSTGDIRVDLRNQGGNLDLAGSVRLHDGAAELDLLLAPRDAADATLSNVLSLIATPQGGRWRLRRRVPLL